MNIDELIERAKQESKDDFLRFVTGIYGIDECVFDHIWEVPVIAPWGGDILVTEPLSTMTEDEILDKIDEFIYEELGEANGCFISTSKMASEFTIDEIEEWREKIYSDKLKMVNDSIIVYNEPKLKKEYIELIKSNSTKATPKTQEELEQLFVDFAKGVITHERCHLNANYFVTELEEYKDEMGEHQELISTEVNGASLTDIEYDEIISSKKDTAVIQKYNDERNEVLIDTLSQMMNNYQEGDNVEDCLFKIIEERKGKSPYDNIDDKEVLTMYALFPEELTEWVMFGAYDLARENKLQKMIIEVCGTDMPLEDIMFKKKVEQYVMSLEEGTLSNKQMEMLEMLKIPISRNIDKEDIKKVAMSEKALGACAGSLQDVNVLFKGKQKEDTTNEK